MPFKSLRHRFRSLLADADDVTLVRPSDWNAEHDFWYGHRDVAGTSDTLAHDDHLSVITYSSPTGCDVRVLEPTGDQFPEGWRARLCHGGGRYVRVVGFGCNINGWGEVLLGPTEALDLQSTGTPRYIGVKTPVADRIPDGGRLIAISGVQLAFVGGLFKHNGLFRRCSDVDGLRNTNVVIGVPGENLAPNTVYWLFVMQSAVTTGLYVNFRLAAHGVGHRPSQTPGNEGTEVLFTGGADNDSHTLIGMVRTNPAGQFMDGTETRWVASFSNRRMRAARTPNMVASTAGPGNDPLTTYSSFLAWNGDPIFASFGAGMVAQTIAGASSWIAIGMDGVAITPNSSTTPTQAGVAYNIATSGSIHPAEGYHYLHPWIGVAGGTGSFYGNIDSLHFI